MGKPPNRDGIWTKTTSEAKSIIDSEREAARKKTERLRKLRLAKEADEGVTEIDKKPSPKKAESAREAEARLGVEGQRSNLEEGEMSKEASGCTVGGCYCEQEGGRLQNIR